MMKKYLYTLTVITFMFGCKTRQPMEPITPQPVLVTMDLVNVENDRVMVTVDPGKFESQQATFYIPKTVPGTYSVDNYGEFIENLKAFDYLGDEMLLAKTGENFWLINNAEDLDKITYWVNDSYDVEGEEGIFSPAGTNIEEGENFMLNLHGFVGYFENLQEQPYKLIISRPEDLIPGTSMPLSETMVHPENASARNDSYDLTRYFQIIDNPIMYAAPDTSHIKIQDMNVLVHVYSPNDVYSSESIEPEIEKMITAQKRFLGDIDETSEYAILLYLSNPAEMDAKGFGALEHHTSTVVVLPETMPLESLNQTMTDVVSHEFFHILTPLNVHSNEIHFFNYNEPEMSKHLWMYEGVTEYFAHLFQVNQDLINNQEFYDRMAEKIEGSKNFNDTVPFTVLSKNILEEPYRDEYYNVYLKGALIGMALDLRLRELSEGEEGLLDLMADLSQEYGVDQPFEDDELIPQIVEFTYPEIETFFEQYVSGTTPIPYEEFLAEVGLEMQEERIDVSYFIKGQTPYIDGNPETGELFFREGIGLNSFLQELGVENGDVIKSVNGTEYTIQNVYELVAQSQAWEEGEEITMVVERDDEEIELTGKISQPTDVEMKIIEMDIPEDDPRVMLRRAWLKD